MVDCKTCEHENVCPMPDFVRNNLKLCRKYRQKKPQTQGDRIRAMSDEELAEFLNTLFIEGQIEAIHEQYPDSVFNWKDSTLKYLKSEVKE